MADLDYETTITGPQVVTTVRARQEVRRRVTPPQPF
jgi:hypothetical protein